MNYIKSLMKCVATLAVAICVLVPGSALAQGSSTCQAYNPQLCTVKHDASSAGKNGQLPFTGLDVVLLAVGGGTLLGAGLVVRGLSGRLD